MRKIFMTLCVFICLSTQSASAAELTDPYAILQKHFEAMGGLEKLKAEKSSYLEADIELVGTGLKGSLKVWRQSPIMKREEVDLGIFKQTMGDNGEYSWEADANDKVRIVKDESSLARREIDMLRNEYRYADPEATEFKITLIGIDTVGGADCYLLEQTNTINEDVRTEYIDTATFMMLKTVETQPDQIIETLFSDYRENNGVLHSFSQVQTVLPNNQVIALTITELQINPEIDPALFESPQEVVDYRIVDSVKAANVPFEFIDDHIFLRVSIDCRERLWVLDNGAGVTVLDQAYADELGLQSEGKLPGSGIGNTVEFGFVDLPEYSLPGIEFSSQRVAVLDMSDLKRKIGLDVVGILGYDFLSRFVTKVDYANERLGFYDPASFSYSGDGAAIEAPLQDHIHTVSATVDGIYQGRWRLDTGAGGCSFHYRFAEEHDLLDRPGVERLATGAGGTLQNRTCRFQSIELAGMTIADPLISVTTGESKGGFSWSDKVGNIGNSLLRHFVIYLDYQQQQLIVERGANFDKHFPSDYSGLQVLADSDSTAAIYFVAPASPAARAGLKSGDRLLAVSQIPVERLAGLAGLRKLFQAEPGTEYRIDFLRGDRRESCKFRLEVLI